MDNEFVYFIHEEAYINPEIIDAIFSEGLINTSGHNIDSTMEPAPLNGGQIKDRVKDYSKQTGKTKNMFVIRIPKYYLTPRMNDGRLKQFPLPIWKKVDKTEEHDEAVILPPELIYGVYNAQNNSFDVNPNYSPVYDPSGLQFDDSQIKYFKDNKIDEWATFAEDRKKESFYDLKKVDERSHAWDQALSVYRPHFGYIAVKKAGAVRAS